jgi:hypothetical protein
MNDLKKGTIIKFKSWDGYFNVGKIEEFNDGKYKVHSDNSRLNILYIEPSDIVSVIEKDVLKKGTLIKFKSWDGYFNVGTIESFYNGKYKVKSDNSKLKLLYIQPSDIVSVIEKDANMNIEGTEEISLIEEPAKLKKGGYALDVVVEDMPKVEIEHKKDSFYGMFANGGNTLDVVVEEIPKVEIEHKKDSFYGMFDNGGYALDETMEVLPNELTIYIPLFDSNEKPLSDEELEAREFDVKDFLTYYFGDYLVKNIASSYVDDKGELIMQKHIQISSYCTDAEFNDFKHILFNQISVWAGLWNQEKIVLEYEDEIYDIRPMEDMMEKGGELWIQDALTKMRKKGTVNSFTKQAKREGLTPIEFAKKVLKNPKGYILKTRRRAMFVKNTNPEKF